MREVRAGIPYTPPPKQLGYKRDPMDPLSSISLPDVTFADRAEAEHWLTNTFKGVGTVLAKEAASRIPESSLNSQSAWFALNELLSLVRTGDFTPVVYRSENGQVLGAYPFRMVSVAARDQADANSMSEALEYAYSAHVEADTFDREQTALLVSLRKTLKGAVKTDPGRAGGTWSMQTIRITSASRASCCLQTCTSTSQVRPRSPFPIFSPVSRKQ